MVRVWFRGCHGHANEFARPEIRGNTDIRRYSCTAAKV